LFTCSIQFGIFPASQAGTVIAGKNGSVIIRVNAIWFKSYPEFIHKVINIIPELPITNAVVNRRRVFNVIIETKIIHAEKRFSKSLSANLFMILVNLKDLPGVSLAYYHTIFYFVKLFDPCPYLRYHLNKQTNKQINLP